MDLTNEMHVTKPFGPTIGKIQVIPQFVNDLNDYSNEVIKDKDKAKNLDAGKTLVGAVTQEISLEKEFFSSDKPAKVIAIREASSVSIPNIPGPSCIIASDKSSCKPPPR